MAPHEDVHPPMTSIDPGSGVAEPPTDDPQVAILALRDGLQLCVRRWGGGPAVVLLHGFTGSGAAWGAHVVTGVSAAGHAVIAPDLPGHGDSSTPHEAARYRCRNVVRDIVELIDAVSGGPGEAPVDLVGYSMGARVGLAVAATHPERVRRLVLEGGSPGLADEDERARRRSDDGALAAMLRDGGLDPFLDLWNALPLFAPLRSRLRPDELAALDRQRATNDPLALAAVLDGLGTGSQPSFWDALDTVRCPTLLLTGSLDAKFTAIAREMVERMPRAEHRVVPGAGHRIHLEDPKSWVDAVVGFLA